MPGDVCDTATGTCGSGGGGNTCTDGDKQCNGDTVEECFGGSWIQTSDCAAMGQTCNAGACVAGSSCTQGDKRCSNNTVEVCDATGNWIYDHDCGGDTCSGGVCVGNSPMGAACPWNDMGVNTSASSCQAGLLCAGTMGDFSWSCNSDADCPMVSSWHPDCVGGSCYGTSCVVACGSNRSCPSGFHAEDVSNSCLCLPGSLSQPGERCNTLKKCAWGSCIELRDASNQGVHWGFCSFNCGGDGDCTANSGAALNSCQSTSAGLWCERTCGAGGTCPAGQACFGGFCNPI
ncbi:MAG: hypothetical protein D6729_13165 [Deltaproteobacteria bacterium]|nr:MAG: hypothetical protein D6729_13165 [Deltaproteobacteria bacterium]